MSLTIVVLAALLLAYANGANDNFKGVATLLGSRTTDYRRALLWATSTTFLGSLAAVVLAHQLLERFSGKGLVSGELATTATYGSAVALGAGLTVLAATRLGLPISTTHSLLGSLVGAGVAAGSTVDLALLSQKFAAPLLASPVLAILITAVVYPILHWGRRRLGVTETTCLCVGEPATELVSPAPASQPAAATVAVVPEADWVRLEVGEAANCQRRYEGRVWGIEAADALDRLHYLSAGLVSFARGLNDTPKIAALLLLAPAAGDLGSLLAVGVLIAAGGWISARRVAHTMSERITTMNHGQGFAANVITGLIVIGASRLGMPVSTTHVSCGSLFGIGMATREARWKTIAAILLAWITTLPLGAALGAASYWVIRSL